MERVHPPPPPPPQHSSSKMERKFIEKNRRNHMKALYSNLYSLLPNIYKSKESLPVPDQIDEAVNYIKSLQIGLEKSKEKKENLLAQKGKRSCVTRDEKTETSSSRLPQFEIHEMGPSMDIISISGLDNQATFYSILRSLDEEGLEVVNANFSSSGTSMFQVAHAKDEISTTGIISNTVARRLKELIYGHPRDNQEPNLDSWDFDIEADDRWGSGILDPMPIYVLPQYFHQ